MAKIKIVPEWKVLLFHSLTAKVATGLGALAGVMASHEIIAIGLLNFLPEGKAQLIGAAFLGFMVFGVPTIAARLIKQPKLDERLNRYDNNSV
jgi:hypothetical protein